jgi:hypothetical protein
MLTMTSETIPKPYTVADVARILGWSEATIHRHSCALSEWKRERGQIPLVRVGSRDYVPRWWVEETLRALTVAPK